MMDSFMAVLDGQQRLTSLYLGLKGTVAYHLKNYRWEKSDRNFPPLKLYLNLSKVHKGEDSEVESNEGMKMYEFLFRPKVGDYFPDLIVDNQGKWFRCGKILSFSDNDYEVFLADNNLSIDERVVLNKFRSVIMGTDLHYYVENEVSSDKVVDIFVRINSGGKVLSLSDIALSLVIAGWKEKDGRKEFQELIDIVRNLGFYISHDYIIKTFLYLLDKTVKTKISTFNNTFIESTKTEWDNIREAITELFRMLKTMGFNQGTLTSLNATLPLLYFIYKRNLSATIATSVSTEKQRGIMKKWLLKSILLKSFGASSDNVLTQARNAISPTGDFPADAISKAIRQPESINQESIDNLLSTQKDNPYAFSILALFYPNVDLSNKFNLDHMHPLALFDDYVKANQSGDKNVMAAKYNSIVNLQLLGENQNKSKSDMSLEEWVQTTNKSRESLLAETYLPTQIDLATSNFEQFYTKRKELLTKQLCKELGVTLMKEGQEIDLETEFDEDEDSSDVLVVS
ncbi:MAG: DUF262 domain-containing protein [Bacteroidales bacterium]|nr:DUF262 domain-containing protein [Bacteroidales bacterium]